MRFVAAQARYRAGVHHAPLRDDDHVVGEAGEFGQLMARHEDRSPQVGEGAEEVPQPPDAFGVEPVGGLVQDEDLRSAEQSRREP